MQGSTEILKPRPGKHRHKVVFGLLVLALAGLAIRLLWVMQDHRPEAQAQSRESKRTAVSLPARPGNIYARARSSYVLMAASKQVPSCFADPAIVEDRDLAEVSIRAGEVLGLDARDVLYALVRRRTARFVWLKRGIAEAEADAVRTLRIGGRKVRGIGITHEWERTYPSGPLAAPVIGFRRRDGVAGGGVEASCDRQLRGTDGRRAFLIDAGRRPIWRLPDESCYPRDGSHVFLTIDASIQAILDQAVADAVGAYEGKWGCGVVVEPRTGNVMAMSSVPTYDPSRYNEATDEERTNRAVTVPFEPGSVLKGIYAASAVRANLATYATPIFCENGSYRAYRGGWITDHGSAYGCLTLTDVVVHSSNIGMAKVGELLGNRRMYAIAQLFGLGAQTGVRLPGESCGIMRPADQWDGYSLRRVPFGQEISVTALQLTMAYAVLANGGLLMRPRLVEKVTDTRGRVLLRTRPEVVRRVLTQPVAAQSLAVLEQVVERGTGKKAQLERWTVFGKTGTAQIAGRGGYVPGAYVSSFIGGAPVGSPAAVCLISVYWPRSRAHYGGTVAAPYVKEVLKRTLTYLNIPPDKPEVLASLGSG